MNQPAVNPEPQPDLIQGLPPATGKRQSPKYIEVEDPAKQSIWRRAIEGLPLGPFKLWHYFRDRCAPGTNICSGPWANVDFIAEKIKAKRDSVMSWRRILESLGWVKSRQPRPRAELIINVENGRGRSFLEEIQTQLKFPPQIHSVRSPQTGTAKDTGSPQTGTSKDVRSPQTGTALVSYRDSKEGKGPPPVLKRQEWQIKKDLDAARVELEGCKQNVSELQRQRVPALKEKVLRFTREYDEWKPTQ